MIEYDDQDDDRSPDDECPDCHRLHCVCDDPAYDETAWDDGPGSFPVPWSVVLGNRVMRRARRAGVALDEQEADNAAMRIIEHINTTDVTAWRVHTLCVRCRALGTMCNGPHCDDIPF